MNETNNGHYNLLIVILLGITMFSCGDSNKPQGDEVNTDAKSFPSLEKINEVYKALERLSPKAIEGKSKSFDLASFISRHTLKDKTNFSSVESSFVDGANVFLERSAGTCKFIFRSYYELHDEQSEFRIDVDLIAKDTKIFNQEGKKIDVPAKNTGSGVGKSIRLEKELNSVSKIFETKTDCQDREDYAGFVVFDYKIVDELDTQIVTKNELGKTIRIGNNAFKVESIHNNLIVCEVISIDNTSTIEFKNLSSDLENELGSDIYGYNYGITRLQKSAYEIFKSNNNIAYDEFKISYESKPIEDELKYWIFRAPSNIESCLFYIKNYTETKEMQVDYVVDPY